MRLNEVIFSDVKPIDGYGPGFFRIGGEAVEGAVCVGQFGVRGWGGYEDTDSLTALVGEVDVLFIGTGAETAHVPGAFRSALEEAGLGVEAMNSPAAARTYNVLISEGRRVAAALFPV